MFESAKGSIIAFEPESISSLIWVNSTLTSLKHGINNKGSWAEGSL